MYVVHGLSSSKKGGSRYKSFDIDIPMKALIALLPPKQQPQGQQQHQQKTQQHLHQQQEQQTLQQPLHTPPHQQPAPPHSELLLRKTGAGRLYYRATLRCSPRACLGAPAVQRGFCLTCELRGDGAARSEDGGVEWVSFKAGATVVVTVRVTVADVRHHVALVILSCASHPTLYE